MNILVWAFPKRFALSFLSHNLVQLFYWTNGSCYCQLVAAVIFTIKSVPEKGEKGSWQVLSLQVSCTRQLTNVEHERVVCLHVCYPQTRWLTVDLLISARSKLKGKDRIKRWSLGASYQKSEVNWEKCTVQIEARTKLHSGNLTAVWTKAKFKGEHWLMRFDNQIFHFPIRLAVMRSSYTSV